LEWDVILQDLNFITTDYFTLSITEESRAPVTALVENELELAELSHNNTEMMI
jgi:hypothetical protein